MYLIPFFQIVVLLPLYGYYYSLIETWVWKPSRVIRLQLYLSLLIEVKTSACAVWQQKCRSRAQRMEDRKVLIVSLSVTCKSEKGLHHVDRDVRRRSWNSLVSEQKCSYPQKLVNLKSHTFKRAKNLLPTSRLLQLLFLKKEHRWAQANIHSVFHWAAQWACYVEKHSVMWGALIGLLKWKWHSSHLDSI